jgi:hypothetical protein
LFIFLSLPYYLHTAIMKFVAIAIVVVALLVSISTGFKWEGTDANGHPVVRTFTVLKSPAMGNPYTFAVLATQRNIDANGKKTKVQDAIEFTFSVVGLPHYVLRYFQRSTDAMEHSAFRHALRKLIEYVPDPENVTAGFEPGVTNKTSEMYFWNAGKPGRGFLFGALQVTTTMSNNATVYQICTANDAGVTFCFFGSDVWAQLMINGSTFSLDPNAFHHTLNISGYPFLRNDTQLALKTHVDVTKRCVTWNDSALLDSNEAALDVSDPSDTSNSTPVAAWVQTVDVTGDGCSATAAVVRSVIFDGEVVTDTDANITVALAQLDGEIMLTTIEKMVYFSYLTDCPKPTDIYWDPEVGVAQNPMNNEQSSAAAFNIPTFVLIAMGLFAFCL